METLFGIEVPLFFLLLPIAFLLIYWTGTRKYDFWRSRGIPGPRPQPFFGNQWQMNKKSVQKSLCDWSRQYGRVYGIYLNRQPMLVTNDLDILREVLVKEFPHFTDRYSEGTGELFKKTVFFADGHDWRRIRNIMTPTFTSGKLRLMEPFVNRCSQTLSDNLRQIARYGGKINVKEYFGAFTLDVITGTAFGLEINSQEDLSNPFVTNIIALLDGGGTSPSFFRQLLTVHPLIGRLGVFFMRPFIKNFEGLRFFEMAVRRIVEERKTETTQRKQPDFVQLLLSAELSEDIVQSAAENGKYLTNDEICAQIMIFFLAGYETTATTLQYLSYNLAVHQDIQQKIVDEIRQEIGDDTPTCDNVSRLKYLEAVVYETLRLFPPVASVNRMASETVTIKGVTIPQGAGVIVPIYDVMRDPENFPDPEVFNPERFSEANKADMNPVSFLAFGFGPRLCIGKRLALLEIKMAVVHVLRKIRFLKTQDLPEKLQFKSSGDQLVLTSPLMIKAELRQTEKAP